MDKHQDETTAFEVAGDGVSTSGISSPRIVLESNNTLSWGINECSSSFQSVSSCETLESYDPNAVTTESPQVIVVPFLADNQITGTMIANNGVHIPLIKECSIRIDPLKMAAAHCDVMNVEKIIELPFNTDATSDCSTKTPACLLSDDDSSVFEGFDVESIIGTEYELYKEAVRLIKEKAERAENIRNRCSTELIVIEPEPILTERILTERHFMERQPPNRNIKPETVKRPRQIQRKTLKTQPSDDVIAPNNQIRKVNTVVLTEVNVATSKQNNVVKPVVPKPDRVSSLPVDAKTSKPDSSSDSSDSDSDVIPIPVTPTAPTDTSAKKKKLERSADIKHNSKEKELKKLEKIRRRKELSMVAERIRDHWRETFAAARRKQRKKEAKKSRIENSKYKGREQQRHRKRKRVSCSSDSDSTDSSSSSRTSCSSSSSDSDTNDSDRDTYTSDTSYTSQTSHTRTESDSTDSDSSDLYRRYKRRLNRYRRSPSVTSDTSGTTSSDDDDDDDDGAYDNRRKFHFLKKAHRKQSKSHENCTTSRKRKLSESHRSEELLHRKQRKIRKTADHRDDEPKRMKNRTTFSQKHQKFNVPSRSSSAEKVKKVKAELANRSAIESTSAGAFSVKQCCFK